MARRREVQAPLCRKRGAVELRRAGAGCLRRGLGLTIVGLWILVAWGGAQAGGGKFRPAAAAVGGGDVVTAAPAAPHLPRGGYVDAPVQDERSHGRPRGNTPEGAGFADWVVSTDPQRQYLLDAFVRDNRILGVIVNPRLKRGQVRQMLTSLLSGMQRTFPGQPLEIIAYYRSGDQLARLTWDPQTKQAHTVLRH